MGLRKELSEKVSEIFSDTWSTRNGREIPEENDIQLYNDGVKLDATVLYADLADSTDLVDNYPAQFAAEIYKSYLTCALRVINANGGEITAFDGDRVMSVFIGNSKNSSAAKAALQINWAVRKIINPALEEKYPRSNYRVSQVVGIDRSKLLVARTGIRGTNDLVWVGRAANYAAKLNGYPSGPYATYITEDVYKVLNKRSKYDDEGNSMWEFTRSDLEKQNVLRSSHEWSID